MAGRETQESGPGPHATRRIWWVVACLTLLATAPIAGLPLMMDDWFHLSALDAWSGVGPTRAHGYFEGWVHEWGSPNTFAFFQDRHRNVQLVESGVMPWWTAPELRVVFLRPLTSLTHLFDHGLFGMAPVGPHLHSLLWYFAVVAAAALFYRRILPARTAALAALLFAIDEGHWFPAAWIANRNALVAVLPALLGLVAHIRWREDDWRPGLPLSIAGLALGLAGGEPALGVFAMLGCYQLLADHGALSRKLRGLAPALCLGLVWAVIYKTLGYGAHSSGLYIDPASEPLSYLVAAAERAPMLIGAMTLGLPADAWFFAPAVRVGLVLGGFVGVALTVWGLRWLLPRLDASERRTLGWTLPAALLSLTPVLATFPLNRLLLVPGLAMGPLMAMALDRAWTQRNKWVAGLVGVPQLIAPVFMWWGMTWFALDIGAKIDDAITRADIDPSRHNLVPHLTDPALGIYMPVEREYRGLPFPESWSIISSSPSDHQLTRTAPDRLELQVVDGAIGYAPFELLFRNFDTHPMAVGDTVLADGLHIEVLDQRDGRATRMGITLGDPIDTYALLAWQNGTLVELPIPEVGASVLLAHTPGPMGI